MLPECDLIAITNHQILSTFHLEYPIKNILKEIDHCCKYKTVAIVGQSTL